VRFPILFLLLAFSPGLVCAQSDFRLTTAPLPRLEDALIPLPAPLGDAMVRETLDSKVTLPKPEELLKQVVNQLKTRQFEQALPRLEYLQSLRPTGDPDILILRGCVYAESGRPDIAESIFRKVVVIVPTHIWARLNLAEALLTQQKYAEAEQELSILSAARPESEVVRYKLILAMALQKKIAPAEQELQHLEEHASTPAYYFAKAAIAFAAGDASKGKDLVGQARKSYAEGQTKYFYASLATQKWVPAEPE
jgi:predicted Zn-dependent protease